MSRHGRVFVHDIYAGELSENEEGTFSFSYDDKYLATKHPKPVSLTLPLRQEPYHSQTLFPFFDGLIPEGWLLNIATKNWKIDSNDRMELLLRVCGDCIGSVHIDPVTKEQI
jgi:serine/threonine-protein kinase HipA